MQVRYLRQRAECATTGALGALRLWMSLLNAFGCSDANVNVEESAASMPAGPGSMAASSGVPSATPNGTSQSMQSASGVASEQAISASSTCAVKVDHDGDGVLRTDHSACAVGSETKNGFAYGEDCNDDDPSRSEGAQFYLDADGDGWGTTGSNWIWGCKGDALDGLAASVPDCDDGDPARTQAMFTDADGDGVGVGNGQCLPTGSPGFGPLTGDCNDADAKVSPSHDDEDPLDGEDSDCDGNDYPFLPSSWDSRGEWGPPVSVGDAARCEGRALSILASEVVGGCNGGIVLQIGNRGSETVSGARLHLLQPTTNVADTWIALPDIEPGKVVRAEQIHIHATVRIEDVDNAGDCEALGEVGKVEGFRNICK